MNLMRLAYLLCAFIGACYGVHLAHQEMHDAEKAPVVQPYSTTETGPAIHRRQ